MRPYRGKTRNGNWVKGWYCTIGNNIECILPPNPDIVISSRGQFVERIAFIEVIPATVGQSTGRKDEKRTKEYPEGQEIFEGDIMEYYNACVRKGEDPNCQQVVRWNKRQACFEGCFNGGEVIATIHDEDKKE